MQNNSNTVFLKYYLKYYEKIYRYLYFRSYENKELAEDLTSETFMKALEKFDTFDSERKFSSWVYAIARNCLIDHSRKYGFDKEVPLEEEDNVFTSTEKSWTSANTALTRKRILNKMEDLPENLRELILLKYFNEYENHEIQEMLDLNPNTLRVQLHRAMKILRQNLSPNLISLILFFFTQ